MDFIDLAAQQRRISEKLSANIARVLAHGQYINGPEVRELEEALAAYVGARHAVGCASGTDALLMALMALEIGPGDAVFTTPFTFIATAEVISLLGATPVFVDIDPVTFNLDPVQLERAVAAVEKNDPAIHPLPKSATAWNGNRLASLGIAPRKDHDDCANPDDRRTDDAQTGGEIIGICPPFLGKGDIPTSSEGKGKADISPSAGNEGPGESGRLRPRAVIPVDLFGLPADYDAIGAVAARHGLAVVEDAAQSFGGEYRGKKAGAFGRIACTSFFPAKPLGCYGDAGMCFTDDDLLTDALRSIRVHGQGSDKYDNVRIGINGRLDTLQAAILLAKFSIFPEEVELRQEVAKRYDALLAGIIKTPVIPNGYKSAWAQYSLLARDDAERTALMAKLRTGGVPTAIYYPKPLHRQAAFAGLGYGGETANPAQEGKERRGGEIIGSCPPFSGRLPEGKIGSCTGFSGQQDASRSPFFPVSEDCARRIFSLPMHPYLEASAQQKIAALLS
jgi:dTDP-4-amino-4,6-dideoxygalactose transaminase